MRGYQAVIGLSILCACGGDSNVTNPPGSQQFSLTIQGSGPGAGRVQTSAGLEPPLDCALASGGQASGTCSGSYSEGTTVDLTVTPDASSTFDGWADDASSCATARSCSIDMTASKTAIAQLSAGSSGVQITSSTYYVDPEFGSEGAIIWVAEARNNTNQTVQSADIEFTSHDGSGQVLASDVTFVGPIPPGETRASQSLADLLGTEASVDIRVSDIQFATEDPHLSSAQITSSDWRVDTETGLEGAVVWTVEVQNVTGAALESVEVEFVTYDSAGKIVAADHTFLDPIPPGEKRSAQGLADHHGTEATAKFQIASVE
jgi:List-Bact-rpt repeat protein